MAEAPAVAPEGAAADPDTVADAADPGTVAAQEPCRSAPALAATDPAPAPAARGHTLAPADQVPLVLERELAARDAHAGDLDARRGGVPRPRACMGGSSSTSCVGHPWMAR